MRCACFQLGIKICLSTQPTLFLRSSGDLFLFPESKAASRRFACSLKEITVLQQYILTPAGHVNGFSMAASNARRSSKQRFNGRILSRVSRNVVEFSGFIKLYNIFAVLSSIGGGKKYDVVDFFNLSKFYNMTREVCCIFLDFSEILQHWPVSPRFNTLRLVTKPLQSLADILTPTSQPNGVSMSASSRRSRYNLSRTLYHKTSLATVVYLTFST